MKESGANSQSTEPEDAKSEGCEFSRGDFRDLAHFLEPENGGGDNDGQVILG